MSPENIIQLVYTIYVALTELVEEHRAYKKKLSDKALAWLSVCSEV